MVDKLSILRGDEEIDLQSNKSDLLAKTVGGVGGILSTAAPILGPMIKETVLNVIPNQRLERLITFAQVLEIKLKHLTEDFVQYKLQTEEGADLLEDTLTSAMRAMSGDRRGYLASLLKNGLTDDDLDHIAKKKLLSILNSLNDAEVLVLKYHSLESNDGRRDFADKHSSLFAPISVTFGTDQQTVDKASMRDTYTAKLVELGLLRPLHEKPKKGNLPEFDYRSGTLKSKGHEITALGNLLLRYIDLSEQDEDVSAS